MSIAVVSYSLTGNNEHVAARVAEMLGAAHIRVTEAKARGMSRIMLDMVLNRTPSVHPPTAQLAQYDRIVFIAPVWMGQAASPLRSYFRYLQAHPCAYAFASISGGGLNPNPKLGYDLQQRVGAAPAVLVDLHIADLLPPDQKPTMKATSAYRLSEAEQAELSGRIAQSIGEVWGTGAPNQAGHD